MSLTEEELGLSTEDWEALRDSETGSAFELKLYQWQPVFDTITGSPDYFPDFDAVIYGGDLHRVTLNSSDLGTFVPMASPKIGTALSLVTEADDLYVFQISTTGISLNVFDGSSWSGFSQILANANVRFIAATSPTTLHYITYDSTHFYYQLKVLVNDSGWTTTTSDIYWGFTINSFAAQQINGVDVLALASDMPGLQSVQVIGTAINKRILPSGGLFVFTYKYGTWSDHREIDHIDQWSSFRYRSRVRMSAIDDTLWLTCYSSDGTVDTPITGYRVYSSKDGLHWSRGELFPLPNESDAGFVLLATEDQLYAVTWGETYNAKRTLWFGSPHADTVMNVSKYTTALQISRADLQQINFTLDNRRHWLENTFADGSTVLAAILKTGYGEVLAQQGIFEIDTVSFINDLPKNTVQYVGRDRFAWMASRSQSEQFQNWMPQVIGLDEYVDATGTGYGGMTYTAPFEGSFKAADGALQLASSNEDGFAANTWLTDNWNGAVEEFLNLGSSDNSEFIGVFFRAPDQDNGFWFIYSAGDDKIKMIQLAAGTPSTLWQSSAKSWSLDTTGRFIRAVYRYNRVLLYSSTDPSGGGITWDFEHEVIVDGQEDPDAPITQSGYAGSVGKGFSDLSESSGAIGNFPSGTLPDSYTPFVSPSPSTPPDPPPTGDPIADFIFDVGTSYDVFFYDRSVAGDYPITGWAWTLGDTTTSTSENPTHTYPDSSSRSVTLTVTDSNGGTASVTKNVAMTESVWEHISDFTNTDTLQDGWEVSQGTFSSGVGFIASGSDEPIIFYNFPFPSKVGYWEDYYYHDHVAGSATQITQSTLQTSSSPIVDGVYNYTSDYHQSFTNSRSHTANNSNAFGTIFDSAAVQGLWQYNRTSGLGKNTITKALIRGSGHNPFEA